MSAILFVSFRFDLFRFVLFRFVSICFDLFRFGSIYFVSFSFVSVSFRTLQGPHYLARIVNCKQITVHISALIMNSEQ